MVHGQEVTLPAVPQEHTLSEIGLQLRDPALTYEEFSEACTWLGQMYATVKRAEGEVKFMIGDAIIAGEQLFGARSYQAFSEFGMSEEVLGECARVSQRVPRSLRRTQDGLSWSHHRAVAPMEIPQQKAWLDRAVTEHLGHQALRDALRNGRVPVERDICPTCGRPR